jgi:hypothetical protein
MVLEESLFMERDLRMRTSSLNMSHIAYQWLMLEKTPMDHSSLLQQLRLHGLMESMLSLARQDQRVLKP